MREAALNDPFAVCEAIAEDRAQATANNVYAEGYRCAARDIAEAIRAKRQGRGPTQLERDLRDVEIEARTLARVVAAAEDVMDRSGPHTSPAEAVRRVLLAFYAEDDLPPKLRRRPPSESTTRLVMADEPPTGCRALVGPGVRFAK